MPDSGFIDLRIGQGTRGMSDDSVWPSFTDIMTVVVMIFLMALVIIMVRNNDLNTQLSSSIDVNEAISLANRGLNDEVTTLSGAVTSLKRTLGDTEQEKQQLNKDLLGEMARTQLLAEAKFTLESEVADLVSLKSSLEVENLDLLTAKSQLLSDNQSLQTDKERLITENFELTAEKNQLASNNQQLDAEKQGLLVSRDQLVALYETLQADQLALEQQSRQLAAARDLLNDQNQNLLTDKGSLENERLQLLDELDQLRAARQQLETDVASLADNNQQLEQQNVEKQQAIADLGDKQALLLRQLQLITKQFDELELTSDQEVTSLTTRNLGLSEQLDNVTLRLAQLNIELERQKLEESGLLERLANKKQEYEQLQSNEQSAIQQYQSATAEIELLSAQIRKRELENTVLQQEASRQGDSFISLQDQYSSLEEKYRSLVRAARSEAGKEVVQVYFVRVDSGYEYRLLESGQSEPYIVTKGELDQRLSELKARFGLDLYAKVIIPSDSNLSHNEAWRFTQEILNKYDYYYQSQ